MSLENIKKDEDGIAKFFDRESNSMDNHQEKKNLSKTAFAHIDSITNQKAKTAVDVGCGSGRILIQLLENGVQQVTGIDLSSKMIELASKNVEKKTFVQHVKLINGSFLEITPEKIDALSLHRVLCCHPDRERMLEQAIAYHPDIIVLTIPKQWIFLRIPLNILIKLRNLLKRHEFLPYMHKQKVIDKQLAMAGYISQKQVKTFIWVTTVYQKKSVFLENH